MNSEVRDALAVRRKEAILQYAQGIGNIKEACRDFNVSRSPQLNGYAGIEVNLSHEVRHITPESFQASR